MDGERANYCHQCRHTLTERQQWEECTTCCNCYTVTCLERHYDEIVPEELKSSWICPKCRGICNCSACRPRPRHQDGGRGVIGGRGRGRGVRGGRGRGAEGGVEGSMRGRGAEGGVEGSMRGHGAEGGMRGRGGADVERNALEDMETTILSLKESLANEEEARKVVEKDRDSMREVLQRVEAEAAALRKKGEEELKKKEEKLAVLNGSLEDVTNKYKRVLTENIKLSNQVQDLLGKIRVNVTSPPWSSRHQIGKFHNGTRPHGKSVGLNGPEDVDNCSEFIDKQSETSDEFIDHPDFFEQSKLVTEDGGQENYDDFLSMGKQKCNLPRPPLKMPLNPQWHKLGTPSRPSVTKGSSSAKKSSSASSSLKAGTWL